MARLENEDGPIFLSGIPGAGERMVQYTSGSLDSYHGRVQQIAETLILYRSEAKMAEVIPHLKSQWRMAEFPEEFWPRSVLRTPFSGGSIAISDRHPAHFTVADAGILERFAAAFSLGYARYLRCRAAPG
jgi:hypothetical protein